MLNRYIFFGTIIVIITFGLYPIYFKSVLNFQLSKNPNDWATFGNYVGGVLSPILSFISILLIIKSIEHNQRNEKLRSFESLFFNMISLQKDTLKTMELEITINQNSKKYSLQDSVIIIDQLFSDLPSEGVASSRTAEQIALIKNIDQNDNLYNLIRSFYVIIKNISDKLSDENGFDKDERMSHIKTLINFSEFSHLTLLLLCIKFLDTPAARYLKGNDDFKEVAKELGLELELDKQTEDLNLKSESEPS